MSDSDITGSAGTGSGNQAADTGNQSTDDANTKGSQSTATNSNPQNPPWGDDFDPARAWKTIQHLRGREADLEREKKEFADKVKDYEDRDKTETQKLQDRIKELESGSASKDEQVRTLTVQLEAAKRGIVDPEAAATFLNWKEYERDPEAAFNDLKSRKSYLFAQQIVPPVTGGGPTNPQRGYSGQLTREQVEKMSPQEINARWDEVSTFLRSQK